MATERCYSASEAATQVAYTYKSTQMRSTFWRGYIALYQDARPRSANPYSDVRSTRGHVTFSRAYMMAWDMGWTWAEKDGGKR